MSNKASHKYPHDGCYKNWGRPFDCFTHVRAYTCQTNGKARYHPAVCMCLWASGLGHDPLNLPKAPNLWPPNQGGCVHTMDSVSLVVHKAGDTEVKHSSCACPPTLDSTSFVLVLFSLEGIFVLLCILSDGIVKVVQFLHQPDENWSNFGFVYSKQ